MLLVRRAEGTRVLYSRHGIFAYLLIIVNKFDFGQNLTVQSNFSAKPFQDLLVSLFEEVGYKSRWQFSQCSPITPALGLKLVVKVCKIKPTGC